MAHTAVNTLTSNPIVLEVFSAAVTISSTPITVTAITFVSAAAGDDFALQTKGPEDNDGVVVIHLAQNISGGMVSVEYGPDGHTFESLYFDHDIINAGLGAGDRVCIYLK